MQAQLDELFEILHEIRTRSNLAIHELNQKYPNDKADYQIDELIKKKKKLDKIWKPKPNTWVKG